MIKSGKGLFWVVAASVLLTLATSGCATKKYVSRQINPVNQKLNQYQKQTNDKVAWLTNKQQTDISQVNERIATTDQRVTEVANAVQAAQGTASRAMEEADSNKTGIEENRTAIASLNTGVANALSYQLVDKSDVMFAFNKATLTPAAKASLDQVIAKVQGLPRAVVEVTGFTDRVGSPGYNYDLSRRRAWAVERYLVEHKIPSRSIHVVGLGEMAVPEGMESETHAVKHHGKAEPNKYDRRVNIRIFGAGELSSPSPSQQ